MNTNKIEDLLLRYERGETGPTEEKELERFFTEETRIPPHLTHWCAYFRSLRAFREREVRVPEGLEDRLSILVDSLETCEKRKAPHRRLRMRLLRFAGSAAAVLLLVFAVATRPDKASRPTPEDTFATPEEAQAEVERVFRAFSKAIGQGVQEIKTVEKATYDMQKSIIRQLTFTNTKKS